MVLIESPLVVSYLTSIVFNIVSLAIFEILDGKIMWSIDLGRFKSIQGQRSWWLSIIAHGCFPIRLPLTWPSYMSPLWKYLTCNFNDLELGRFKVIQDQRSWYQWKTHWWFPVWPPLCPTSHLAPYSIYLMPKSYELKHFHCVYFCMVSSARLCTALQSANC